MNNPKEITKTDSKSTRPILRITYSNFNLDKQIVYTAPWVSLTVTLEIRDPGNPAADFFFQLTLPGCLFHPFRKGLNGEEGYFRPPAAFGIRGTAVNGPQLKPAWVIKEIENSLRKHSGIIIWKKRAEIEFAKIDVDPRDERALKRLKKMLRSRKKEQMRLTPPSQ